MPTDQKYNLIKQWQYGLNFKIRANMCGQQRKEHGQGQGGYTYSIHSGISSGISYHGKQAICWVKNAQGAPSQNLPTPRRMWSEYIGHEPNFCLIALLRFSKKSTWARLAIGLFKYKKFCHWNGSIWAIADFFSPPPPLRSEPLLHPLPIAVEPCGESFTFLWWWWPTPIYTVPIPTLGWRKIAKFFSRQFCSTVLCF